MSERNVDLITAPILARIPSIRSETEGLALFRDLVIGLARNSADHAFWKVQTEQGWTPEASARLSELIAANNTNAITETVHHFGGTLQMAIKLADVWVATYHERLKDLYASPLEGGHA